MPNNQSTIHDPFMKREGRQHGTVRTYTVWPGDSNRYNPARLIENSGSPPTTGSFTLVPPKPTNHSKYTSRCGTGRCGQCHRRPCGKSKNKVKGSHKWKWHDAVSNHGVAARWAEEGGRRPLSGYCCDGVSVAGMLENLASDVDRDDGDYQENDDGYENL